MKKGEQLPELAFKATSDICASLTDYQGQWMVLYFYPKDATPGCSIEARDFRDAFTEFNGLNTVVFGISRDTLASHHTFKTKQSLPFELISDDEETLCQLFDVIKIKSMYGKQCRGIERSTFLINPQGIIEKQWRRVKVVGHVDEVLAALKEAQANKNIT